MTQMPKDSEPLDLHALLQGDEAFSSPSSLEPSPDLSLPRNTRAQRDVADDFLEIAAATAAGEAGPISRVLYEDLAEAYRDLARDYEVLRAEADDLGKARLAALERVGELEAELKEAAPRDVSTEVQDLRDETARLRSVITTQRRLLQGS